MKAFRRAYMLMGMREDWRVLRRSVRGREEMIHKGVAEIPGCPLGGNLGSNKYGEVVL